ncbi:hypothetical protein C7M84_017870 [Penaeus vannamei]|uniref:Uncharacterized protein n=1 Tax=Penaeus vannamei TaxID=6689 RepID=A0A423SJ02_PENVA|nr:hypothetical protein C7M84_017870 [Penaeus vannamei]
MHRKNQLAHRPSSPLLPHPFSSRGLVSIHSCPSPSITGRCNLPLTGWLHRPIPKLHPRGDYSAAKNGKRGKGKKLFPSTISFSFFVNFITSLTLFQHTPPVFRYFPPSLSYLDISFLAHFDIPLLPHFDISLLPHFDISLLPHFDISLLAHFDISLLPHFDISLLPIFPCHFGPFRHFPPSHSTFPSFPFRHFPPYPFRHFLSDLPLPHFDISPFPIPFLLSVIDISFPILSPYFPPSQSRYFPPSPFHLAISLLPHSISTFPSFPIPTFSSFPISTFSPLSISLFPSFPISTSSPLPFQRRPSLHHFCISLLHHIDTVAILSLFPVPSFPHHCLSPSLHLYASIFFPLGSPSHLNSPPLSFLPPIFQSPFQLYSTLPFFNFPSLPILPSRSTPFTLPTASLSPHLFHYSDSNSLNSPSPPPPEAMNGNCYKTKAQAAGARAAA